MLLEGVDTLVMGCTHFPFVIPLIKQIAGGDVRVIDPAPAVARQVRRMLEGRELLAERERAGKSLFLTSGDAEKLKDLLPKLVGIEAEVDQIHWENKKLRNRILLSEQSKKSLNEER